MGGGVIIAKLVGICVRLNEHFMGVVGLGLAKAFILCYGQFPSLNLPTLVLERAFVEFEFLRIGDWESNLVTSAFGSCLRQQSQPNFF